MEPGRTASLCPARGGGGERTIWFSGRLRTTRRRCVDFPGNVCRVPRARVIVINDRRTPRSARACMCVRPPANAVRARALTAVVIFPPSCPLSPVARAFNACRIPRLFAVSFVRGRPIRFPFRHAHRPSHPIPAARFPKGVLTFRSLFAPLIGYLYSFASLKPHRNRVQNPSGYARVVLARTSNTEPFRSDRSSGLTDSEFVTPVGPILFNCHGDSLDYNLSAISQQ